jgi:hypothetical protein
MARRKPGLIPFAAILTSRSNFLWAYSAAHSPTVNLSTGWGLSPCDAKIVPGDYFPVLGVGPALGESW